MPAEKRHTRTVLAGWAGWIVCSAVLWAWSRDADVAHEGRSSIEGATRAAPSTTIPRSSPQAQTASAPQPGSVGSLPIRTEADWTNELAVPPWVRTPTWSRLQMMLRTGQSAANPAPWAGRADVPIEAASPRHTRMAAPSTVPSAMPARVSPAAQAVTWDEMPLARWSRQAGRATIGVIRSSVTPSATDAWGMLGECQSVVRRNGELLGGEEVWPVSWRAAIMLPQSACSDIPRGSRLRRGGTASGFDGLETVLSDTRSMGALLGMPVWSAGDVQEWMRSDEGTWALRVHRRPSPMQLGPPQSAPHALLVGRGRRVEWAWYTTDSRDDVALAGIVAGPIAAPIGTVVYAIISPQHMARWVALRPDSAGRWRADLGPKVDR